MCTPFKVDFTALLQLTKVSSTQRLFDDIKAQGVMILAGDLKLQLHHMANDFRRSPASF